jgi:hypothetical protein
MAISGTRMAGSLRDSPMDGRGQWSVGKRVDYENAGFSLGAVAAWQQIMKNVAKGSVKAFYSLHCVRHTALNPGLRINGQKTKQCAPGWKRSATQTRIVHT